MGGPQPRGECTFCSVTQTLTSHHAHQSWGNDLCNKGRKWHQVWDAEFTATQFQKVTSQQQLGRSMDRKVTVEAQAPGNPQEFPLPGHSKSSLFVWILWERGLQKAENLGTQGCKIYSMALTSTTELSQKGWMQCASQTLSSPGFIFLNPLDFVKWKMIVLVLEVHLFDY